jgi:hypothetical protein
LGGRWSEAIALLPHLGMGNSPPADRSGLSSQASSRSRGVTATGKKALNSIRFLVSQQKYLEMLEMGVQKKALAVLRNELAPVAKDSDVLHTLSG